jgi:F-type H+-transporting ATPase subunit b
MLLDPHLGTIIWTIITFVVVLFVLAKFAWPQMLGALDEREQRIRGALEGAEGARAEAEARQIVAQSREAAEKVHQDIVDKAREESQTLVEQARLSIEREKSAAISQLRREMADLVVQAAGALMDANLDDEKNRNLVDDLISRIPESAQRN